MTRENFYFLLELPLDPPEESPEIIEQAIKKKQIEWSRNRNHPTKGIQAQTNIGLMPTIREVMFDPALCREEAAKAQEILQQRDAQKFTVADHHIEILGSKGYITQDEIDKLSQIDNLDADELRKRIKFPDKPSKKRKLRKPIALGADDKKKTSARTLDETLEGNINGGLKQLSKTSLYDFLDIPANATLTQLKRRARKKKSELSEVSKKDANLTVSDTLAGHCMTIFNNARSRKAYDASRASAHHAELDSDIDIAGLDGFIRYEYFEYLVKAGVQFGMDEVQAADHIETYCLNNNLAVEQAPRQISKTMRIAAGVIAGLVLIAAIVIGWGIHSDNKIAEERAAQKKIKLERVQLYNKVVSEADSYAAEGKYEDAIKVYKQFSNANSNTDESKNAAKKITVIKNKMESENFKRIQQINPDQYDKKLFAYLKHQEKFPKGQHHKKIQDLIASTKEPYYQFVLKMINEHKKPDKENWTECIRLSQLFMNTYKDDERNDALKRNIEEYEENITIKKSFARKRDGVSTADYHTAKKEYRRWVEELSFRYYAKTLMERELKEILKREKVERKKKTHKQIRQHLRKTGGRFKETRKGVVKDSRTGKMWTLLDSSIDYDYQNYDECLDYNGAKKYIKGLRNGGYNDWRLPKPRELQNIYGTNPVFPLNKAEWYWTDENFPYYDDEGKKSIVVTIVSPNSDNVWEKNPPINAKFCGTVRAVRP